MWNSLSLPWRLSFEQGWIAYCHGSTPVGAVVANESGKIHSTGRSRAFEESNDDPRTIVGSPLAHAEVNAIHSIDYTRVNPRECTLYTTVEPCPLCVGAVAMSHIKMIRYAARDPYAGSVNMLMTTQYLQAKRIKAEGPHSANFENIVASIEVDFLLRMKRPSMERVLKAMEREIPIGFWIGRDLFQSGELSRKAENKSSAEDILNSLSSLLLAH